MKSLGKGKERICFSSPWGNLSGSTAWTCLCCTTAANSWESIPRQGLHPQSESGEKNCPVLWQILVQSPYPSSCQRLQQFMCLAAGIPLSQFCCQRRSVYCNALCDLKSLHKAMGCCMWIQQRYQRWVTCWHEFRMFSQCRGIHGLRTSWASSEVSAFFSITVWSDGVTNILNSQARWSGLWLALFLSIFSLQQTTKKLNEFLVFKLLPIINRLGERGPCFDFVGEKVLCLQGKPLSALQVSTVHLV